MRLSHVEHHIEQQYLRKDLITTAVDNLTKVGYSNITPQRVHARLTSLKENWEKFTVTHDAISLSITKLRPEEQTSIRLHPYFAERVFVATHEAYLEAVEKMNIFSTEAEHEPNDSVPSTSYTSQTSTIPTYFHHACLPRIDIPKFNGSPSDWLSFKDLFSSLILSNPTLTSVEKLRYLKTSLIGSASHLLKNTALTADNFQKAWDALVSFYENKRSLVNAALSSLVTLKRMTRESASEMEQLYTSIMQIYRTLETLKRPVHTWDDFLVFIAVQRLDEESVKAWEHHLGSVKEPPTWNQFSEFLITRLLSLQAFEKSRTGKPASHQRTAKSHFQGKSKDVNSNQTVSCAICSSAHYIANCPQYRPKTIQQRLAIISAKRLCYNCLGSHRASACRTTKRCLKCGHKHHTSIHKEKEDHSDAGTSKSTNPKVDSSKSTEATVLHSSRGPETSTPAVLLATAQVNVITRNKETMPARALIDQGSEISLISERLVQLLRLPRTHSAISLIGVGAQKSNKTKGITSFTLKLRFESDSNFIVTAHILPKLTALLPSINSRNRSWPHLAGLQLADKDFNIPGPIDIILGADVYAQIIEEGIIKSDSHSPIAQRSKLGWILSGPSGVGATSNPQQGYHVYVNTELHDLYYADSGS